MESRRKTPLSQYAMRPDAFLIDVDGTIALHDGVRNPHDWRLAANDKPNSSVITVVKALNAHGLEIAYISGRPESARDLTTRWIDHHVGVRGHLFLRADNDSRKDAIVKRELFERRITPVLRITGVFDDRQQVVDMWRDELGLSCFQVAPGNF